MNEKYQILKESLLKLDLVSEEKSKKIETKRDPIFGKIYKTQNGNWQTTLPIYDDAILSIHHNCDLDTAHNIYKKLKPKLKQLDLEGRKKIIQTFSKVIKQYKNKNFILFGIEIHIDYIIFIYRLEDGRRIKFYALFNTNNFSFNRVMYHIDKD